MSVVERLKEGFKNRRLTLDEKARAAQSRIIEFFQENKKASYFETKNKLDNKNEGYLGGQLDVIATYAREKQKDLLERTKSHRPSRFDRARRIKSGFLTWKGYANNEILKLKQKLKEVTAQNQDNDNPEIQKQITGIEKMINSYQEALEDEVFKNKEIKEMKIDLRYNLTERKVQYDALKTANALPESARRFENLNEFTPFNPDKTEKITEDQIAEKAKEIANFILIKKNFRLDEAFGKKEFEELRKDPAVQEEYQTLKEYYKKSIKAALTLREISLFEDESIKPKKLEFLKELMAANHIKKNNISPEFVDQIFKNPKAFFNENLLNIKDQQLQQGNVFANNRSPRASAFLGRHPLVKVAASLVMFGAAVISYKPGETFGDGEEARKIMITQKVSSEEIPDFPSPGNEKIRTKDNNYAKEKEVQEDKARSQEEKKKTTRQEVFDDLKKHKVYEDLADNPAAIRWLIKQYKEGFTIINKFFSQGKNHTLILQKNDQSKDMIAYLIGRGDSSKGNQTESGDLQSAGAPDDERSNNFISSEKLAPTTFKENEGGPSELTGGVDNP
ncbi:MAG: hypothetical protein GF347_04140 [Candidatus Moranbacteria bacterium]|nr:hypothetical protein [Candidatus Moranbacteria bacterium]